MDFKNAIDYENNPISAQNIAQLCGVTVRTAQRWLAGHSKPKRAALELLRLHTRGRVMPKKWPNGWTFNEKGFLDIGHSKALAWQQVDWYFFSVQCWHNLMELIPRIEARLDALERDAPTALILDLQKYREQLRELKNRPFALPADLREYYELGEIEKHRKSGC